MKMVFLIVIMTLIVSASHGCGEILDKTDQPETSQPPKKFPHIASSKFASLSSPLAAKYYCFARQQFLACMS